MSDLDIDYGAGDSDAEDGISLGGYEDPVVPTAAEDLQVAEVENVVEAIVQPAAAVTASAPVKEEALPEPKTPPRRQPIAGTDWVAKESKSFGGHYYSNLKTGETTWEKPPEIVRAEEAAAAVVAVVRSPTPEPPPPLKLQQQPTGLAALPPKPVFDRPTSTKPRETTLPTLIFRTCWAKRGRQSNLVHLLPLRC